MIITYFLLDDGAIQPHCHITIKCTKEVNIYYLIKVLHIFVCIILIDIPTI